MKRREHGRSLLHADLPSLRLRGGLLLRNAEREDPVLQVRLRIVRKHLGGKREPAVPLAIGALVDVVPAVLPLLLLPSLRADLDTVLRDVNVEVVLRDARELRGE